MSCFVCDKHRNLDLELKFEGFDDFVVSHSPDRTEDDSNFIGALIVEPRVHVKNWAELNDEQSALLGILLQKVNRLLLSSPKVEHVYTWVFGDAVEHFHVWVIPRYIGTPKEYWGVKSAEAPTAPLGGKYEMRGFISYLKSLCITRA
ncbi:hypothetical protein P7M41_24145 [Vibrio parahaemolyticus]|nr:hypothetical protein [Vibrio parahaemolyticus]MDF4264570.1 hypothetical protein [Vibrio parahaemolyticus]MDF4326542.1 hypothetical protein [Vibrio parahaemolyticus]MDG2555122.1 hypothetical protein [Vibrio parahaemolyticus]